LDLSGLLCFLLPKVAQRIINMVQSRLSRSHYKIYHFLKP
jgi:hypothetical protein